MKAQELLHTTFWEDLDATELVPLMNSILSGRDSWRQAYTIIEKRYIKPQILEGHGAIKDLLKNELQALLARFFLTLLDQQEAEPRELSLRKLYVLLLLTEIPEKAEPYHMRLMQLRDEIARGKQVYVHMVIAGESIPIQKYGLMIAERLTEANSEFIEYFSNKYRLIEPPIIRSLVIWKNSSKVLQDVDQELRHRWSEKLAHDFASTSDDTEKVVCAVCISLLMAQETPQHIVTFLVNTFVHLRDSETYLGYEWNFDHFRLTSALVSLGLIRGSETLLEVITHSNTPMRNMFYALAGLLHLLFGDGDLKEFYIYDHLGHINIKSDVPLPLVDRTNNLSQIQKAALTALIRADRVWSVKTNLFDAYQLPGSRDAIQSLVE